MTFLTACAYAYAAIARLTKPHGHYRLTHMKVEVILPNGEVQIVTDVPHFTSESIGGRR